MRNAERAIKRLEELITVMFVYLHHRRVSIKWHSSRPLDQFAVVNDMPSTRSWPLRASPHIEFTTSGTVGGCTSQSLIGAPTWAQYPNLSAR